MPQYLPLSEMARHIGRSLGSSAWIMVDQPMINAFADLTGDRQWVHVDVERATREIGGTIAHGYLTLSLLPQMQADILEITGVAHELNYGLNTLRFLEKVRSGSRVRGHLSLLAVEPRGAGQLLRFEINIEIEGVARPACVAETLVLALEQ